MSAVKYRYMVVDDEPIAHRIIDDYCRALPHVVPVTHAFDAMQAMSLLSAQAVDLLFLDLNMPKLRGFDFLRAVPIRCPVIVTTAHAEFALEAYELNVCDYLLKPYSFERFLKAVHRALAVPAVTPPAATPRVEVEPRTIFVKGDRKHHQVALADIRYIEACGNYSVLRSIDGSSIITPQKISDFGRELSPHRFMRVHKSYLIAIDRISSIAADSLLIGSDKIPIGQSYKQQVLRLLDSQR